MEAADTADSGGTRRTIGGRRGLFVDPEGFMVLSAVPSRGDGEIADPAPDLLIPAGPQAREVAAARRRDGAAVSHE
jgi:hypothetical protein